MQGVLVKLLKFWRQPNFLLPHFLISKLLAISHNDCWLNFESYLHLSEFSLYQPKKKKIKVCPNFVVCTSVIRVCRSPTYFIHDTRENFGLGNQLETMLSLSFTNPSPVQSLSDCKPFLIAFLSRIASCCLLTRSVWVVKYWRETLEREKRRINP